MKTVSNWTDIIISSLKALGEALMQAVPNILGAIFLIFAGWLIAKALSYIIGKILNGLKFDKLMDKMSEMPLIKNSQFNINGIAIIKKFVYWIVLLLFFISASETLGWTSVSQEISNIIAYLPKLFSAVVILIVGLYIATVVKGVIAATLGSLEISSNRIISSAAYYVIATIISITAINQAGIDTSIITSNFTLVIGALMLAFALAFGLGARNLLSNILSATYSRKNFETGDEISIGNIHGKITKIDSISVSIKNEKSTYVIPASRLISENVQKFGDSDS